VSCYTVGATKVLLDTSPFWRFCEGGQVINLARYLGKRAYITLEVEAELKRSAGRYGDLKTLGFLRWPRDSNRLELPGPLKRELLDILRALTTPGEHALKNAGEISTVLMAQHLGGELVVLDDHDGRRLAAKRAVPRLSTAMLAAEMVAVGAIGESEGHAVYDVATPPAVGQHDWDAALLRARAALGASSPAAPEQSASPQKGAKP
jgi:predicted nucleic acid-binding protein